MHIIYCIIQIFLVCCCHAALEQSLKARELELRQLQEELRVLIQQQHMQVGNNYSLTHYSPTHYRPIQ